MEEDNKEYRWETGYEKTWEAITEDADGLVEVSVQELIQKARRKRMNEKFGKGVKLGMMRHLFVVLDMSECMNNQDLKPTRLRCCLKLLENFIEEFFYLNPISQLGVITTRNKRAEVYSELTGNPKRHVESLKKLIEVQCAGEPSLQNSLDTAIQTLRHMPGHASRELLIIMGSLTTCDPTEIDVTLQTCKQLNIRCSVISLAAEVRIFRELTKVTGGDFSVILDDCHFRDLLQGHLEPPPSAAAAESSLIKMGFPCHSGQNESDSYSGLGLCMCHLDVGNEPKLSISGFLCPQCHAKYCELPVECKSCNLTLVSAPHLARSYHHLFPLPAFIEVSLEDLAAMAVSGNCFACNKLFQSPRDKTVFKCPSCLRLFCSDCDIFIHETLHSCPGCASRHPTAHNTNGTTHR